MRILVISDVPWRDDNNIGNTYSSIFRFMENVEFANLYCKAGEPENAFVKDFFQITEKNMLPALFGKRSNEKKPASAQPTVLNRKEQNFYDLARKLRFPSFFLVRELIWKIGKWKTRELDDFLDDFHPDIIFSFCLDAVYYLNVIEYCRNKTKAKLVLFFADDIYAYIDRSPLFLLNKFLIRRKIRKMGKVSDLLYGVSRKLCDEYSQLFGKDMLPLYKICSSVQQGKKEISTPLVITYAGNLYYGRGKTLSMIAEAIRDINRSSKAMQLDIYTSGLITKRIGKALNIPDSSCLKGSIPFAEVEKTLKSSDLVLHVESFIRKEIRRTRLSFSTKIVDCMQSGNCMLAVGPESTASIEYLSDHHIAIVLSGKNREEIRKDLDDMLKNRDAITETAGRMQKFALENHSADYVRKNLYLPLQKLCSSHGENT